VVTGDVQFDLLGLDLDRHLFVQVSRQLNAYRVVRVHWEGVSNRSTASSTEQLARQSFVLCQIVRHAEVIDVRGRLRQAYGNTADFLRSREIALRERRRDLQHAGDVVEAIACIVGRKK